jgi:hypothetical protein
MPLSSEARERCRAFLQPGEETRYLIPGDLGLAGARRSGWPLHPRHQRHRGDRPVLWLAAAPPAPVSVWARHPRATRLGPVDTSSGQFRLTP